MEIKLGEIYTAAASYVGLPFPFDIASLPDYKLKQFKERLSLISGEKQVKNYYGQPVICPVTIGDIVLGFGAKEDEHISIQPLVKFEGKKLMVKKKPVGSDMAGTVKEMIGFDDYKVTITGALISRNQKVYPAEQLEILNEKLWKPNIAQKFDCLITKDLFDHIVVTNVVFEPLTKAPGWQIYKIEALSDTTLEVEFLEGK